MKIALLNESFPPLIDGVSVIVSNYAKILEERGETPLVIVPHMKKEDNDYNFKILRFKSRYFGKEIEYPVGNPFSPKFIRQVAAEKPEICHVHSPFAAAVVARLVRRKINTPMVTTYHTKFDQDFEKRLKSKFMRFVATKFILSNIKASDEVWTVSEGAGDSLRKIGYKGPYRVMPNGTDFKKGVADIEKIKELRNKYLTGESEALLLYVGRVEWYKNIKLSLDSLKILKNNGVKFKFVIVGKGIDLEDIRNYVKQIGLTNYVFFTGPIREREKLRIYYSASDLFLFPSTFDTSGLVVKEAAACNCPSILVDGSCASEGVVHNVNGFITEESPAEFSAAIKKALSDKTRLKEIGQRAGEELYYSFDDAISDTLKKYQEVITRKSS